MVTSYANRTSPVLRGAWILENILGHAAGARRRRTSRRSRRTRTARRRRRCARSWSSTARSRPATPATASWIRSASRSRTSTRSASGAPRIAYAGTPIDASGKLVDGTPVNGPDDLRKALLRAARAVRADADREAHDLRAGPQRGVLRHAGGARRSCATPRATTTASRRS